MIFTLLLSRQRTRGIGLRRHNTLRLQGISIQHSNEYLVDGGVPGKTACLRRHPYSRYIIYRTFAPAHANPQLDMVITKPHLHVSSLGVCFLSYLSNWSPNTSNLILLVAELSKIFSDDPPVRAKPITQTSPTPPQSQGFPQHTMRQQPQQHPQQQPQPQPQHRTPKISIKSTVVNLVRTQHVG